MNNNFSEEYIRGEVAKVMHPVMNCSLVELGIVKSVEIRKGTVVITLAFPFRNIPIADYLEEMVRESIEEIEAPIEFETVIMTKEELLKFLALEKEHWKGVV